MRYALKGLDRAQKRELTKWLDTGTDQQICEFATLLRLTRAALLIGIAFKMSEHARR